MSSVFYQKGFAALLLLLCAVLAWLAWDYQATFSYEPVGPRAWPLILLALLGLGALCLLCSRMPVAPYEAAIKTAASDHHLSLKVIGCIVLLLIYASLFERLGFMPSALLLGVGLAKLYGGRWPVSVASGVILAIGLYWLFDKALDVPLPLGILSDWDI